MAYKRKTTDEIDIEGNYGQGWECVTTATSWAEARGLMRDYRANEGGPFRYRPRRVPIAA